MNKESKKIWPKMVGGGIAGIFEIGLFHPIDTLTKRTMYNKEKMNRKNLSQILFKEYSKENILNKYKSLYTGAKFGMFYKVLQRTYKYGGQSVLNEKLKLTNNKSLNQAITGSLIGAGEVILLPLDVLKIRMQTNPDLIKNKSFTNIIKEEGVGLYRGSGITVIRNMPGSFALFGANSFTKNVIFDLKDEEKATLYQNFISSTIGALTCITVSNPMDVMKVRIQAENKKQNYKKMAKEMLKNEGMGSFFKGLLPKSLTIAPKLIFSFTIAQEIIKRIYQVSEL